MIPGSMRRLASLWSSETTSEYPGYIFRKASALREEQDQSINVVDQVCMMTCAISSGLACFAEAEVPVSARQGDKGLAKTNIGLPISHKSWLVRGGQGSTECRRIRYPAEVRVSWLSVRCKWDSCDYKRRNSCASRHLRCGLTHPEFRG